MSWFGEGLSSLKGQLSNLAQKVLLEEENAPGQANTDGDEHQLVQGQNEVPSQPSTSSQNEEGWREVPLTVPLSDDHKTSSGTDSSSSGTARLVDPSQIQTLHDANLRLTEENIRLNSTVASLRRTIQELESEVAVSQDENANLSTGLEELDIQHQQAIEQLLTVKNETIREYEALKISHRELQDKHNEMVRLQMERDMLDKETPAQEKIEELMNELHDRNEELEAVECENVSLRESVKELSGELEKSKDTLPPILENSEEIEGLEQRLMSLESELATVRHAKECVESELLADRATIDGLNKKLVSYNSLSQHVEQLESEISSLSAQVTDLTNQKSELSEENSRLTFELDEYMSALDGAEDENRQLKNKMLNLESKLQEDDKQIQKLQNEKESLERKMCKILLETNAAQDESKKQYEEKLAEIQQLQEQLNEYKTKVEPFESAPRSHSVIEQELDNTTQNQITELAHNLNSLKLEHSKELADKEAIISDLQTQLNDLSDLHRSKMADVNKELETLQSTSQQYEVLKDISRQKEIEFKNQLKIKDEEITRLKNIEGQSVETVKNLERKLTNFQKSIEMFKENEEKFLKDNLKLKMEYEETHKKLSEDLKSLTTELEQSKALNESLSTELKDLKNNQESVSEEAQLALSNENIILRAQLERSEKQIIFIFNQIHQLIFSDDSPYSNSDDFDVNKALSSFENKFNALKKNIENNESNKLLSLEEKINKLQADRAELTRSIQMKHEESSRYQDEVQRLNTVLSAELKKVEKLVVEKAQLEVSLEKLREEMLEQVSAVTLGSDKEIKTLTQEVESLKNQLDYASQLLKDIEREDAEGQSSTEANSQKLCPNGCNHSLEEINRLTLALNTEQSNNALLKNSVEELREKLVKTENQLSTLKEHLVSVGDNYTSELMAAQDKIQEMQAKLNIADERVRSSSTAYTSANIRANQQVEALTQQVKLLNEEREKLQNALSQAEDNALKQAAALTNLQVVLQQFQNDKKRDIEFETERLRRALNDSCKKQEELLTHIKYLSDQLDEAKKGLLAASRLSEELDRKSDSISHLQKQVDDLHEKLQQEEEKFKSTFSSVEGKIDKNLVKNLIVGYITSPDKNRTQVLRVIGSVLDLNKEERQKVGLESGGAQKSLSEAFIRFLEAESQPKPQLSLPIPPPSVSGEGPSRKTSTSSATGSLLLNDQLPPSLSLVTVPRYSSSSILKDVLNDRNT